MPIIKSAIKRAKQTLKRRERNIGIKRDIKSAVKAFMAEPSAEALAAAHSELDTAVKKNLLKLEATKKATAKAPAKTATKTTAKSTAAKKPAAKKPAAKEAN